VIFTKQNIVHKGENKLTNLPDVLGTKPKKKKILTISDHPLSPSGVGTQTKYFIEALLKTDRYQVVSLGGAIKHNKYDPVRVQPYEKDWVIYPVDNYGNVDIIRSILRNEKPDMVWFMTDPRFYGWLWEIENEIRACCPMVYYHVWDNYPYPYFNKRFYDSNDVIVSISKVTNDIVATVSPDVDLYHVPHAVSPVFQPLAQESLSDFAIKTLASSPNYSPDKFSVFWNNRNARRKQSGTVIWWFKEFLDIVGSENACLFMHTDPKDYNGQDLHAIIRELGLTNGEVMISNAKVPPESLAMMYNVADCTVNISDAEGFGLATLESLSCGTPIIVNMTGGLQEQVTDGKEFFGVGIEPSSKAIIGSQDVPWIYEDRIDKKDFIDALLKLYNMSEKERNALGMKGRAHVMKNYNFETFEKQWVETIDQIVQTHGSWETRKNYKRWHLLEVA
jgi:glycosyltransferase involved in cell wall biosynthesis